MDPAQLQPGHRLDRYELLCPLAYGGMASVWLARFGGRRGFERLVVVKMILPQFSQDPRFQEMFVDEARIASRIEHANVARILDVGEQEESTFIVMEWVDGDSLSKVVRAAEQRKQRIPAGVALRVCADAAAGLHAAHALKERDGTHLGVVHRDVSPQNILISNAGSTVLIDFGVAKARDRVSQDTSAGQLKGKIRYMAPEQALGRSIDHRADVWALGAILYELFAGVPPYDGPNEVAMLHKLTSGALPPPLPSNVPAPVRAVVDRALGYDAEDRYSTALELNLALESCMIEIGEPTTVAVVSHYTGGLLADRKAARKRAVDTALAAAHARDADRASSMPMSVSTPGVPIPYAPHPAHSSTARLNPPIPIAPPSTGELISSPSNAHGVSGISEVPSAASNATMGLAAMEYPPGVVDDPARRRRYLIAAALGVSVAAGVVGAVLIISTAILKPREPRASGVNGSNTTTAPLEPTDPATIGNTAATTTATADPPAPSATATATAAAAATTPERPTAERAPTPPPTFVATPAPLPPPASQATHRPPATVDRTPVAPPKPPPVKPPPPVSTGKSPDRGF
ncbi:MAG: serine/threonine protein kinase [Labilithrix sp.]|nr:serine/threonine protein kinase [Labilithrix sp.]